MNSLIYAHPLLYELSLRLLYRGRYRERLNAVADAIPDHDRVVDLCAGDCAVYRYGLRGRPVEYLACDHNPRFMEWAERKGIPTRRMEVGRDPIPPADCMVMMSSLYQFIPHESRIVEEMIEAARRRVIIIEPVRNWAQSRYALIRWLGRRLARTGEANTMERFDEARLRECLSALGFQTFQPIAGERELLCIFDHE